MFKPQEAAQATDNAVHTHSTIASCRLPKICLDLIQAQVLKAEWSAIQLEELKKQPQSAQLP
jgi:hypothetical protein